MNTEVKTKDIEIGNLYDMNKTIMNKVPFMTDTELDNKVIEVRDWIMTTNSHYLMLLCNERKDYTVFRITKDGSCEGAAKEMIECLRNRGPITAVDLNAETGAYECWIRRSGMSYMYAFFPYDAAVIEC